MAYRSPIIRRHVALPLFTCAFAATTLLYPTTTLHAEAPPSYEIIHSRKPIYDPTPIRQPPKPSPAEPSSTPTSTSPTLTDQLASEIRHVRLFTYKHISRAEDRINAIFDNALARERTFTQTIIALAPPPESKERLMPGSLYVLVAGMAGSIVSRNRNIVLRASVPAAFGLGAAWLLLPITTRNVGDLVWSWEERVPAIAMNHMRVRGAVEEGVRIAKERVEQTIRWSEAAVKDGREVLEGWVKKV